MLELPVYENEYIVNISLDDLDQDVIQLKDFVESGGPSVSITICNSSISRIIIKYTRNKCAIVSEFIEQTYVEGNSTQG